MKNIFYWSPCLSKIGTLKSTINSAISLSRYGKNKFNVKILNTCGEWDEYKSEFKKYDVEVIDLFKINYFNFLPKTGFIKSRFSYLIIFIFSFFPLLRILNKKNPEYLIVHLLTSLPLFLLYIFRFKTRFILRISGMPKLNFFRNFLWKICERKIEKITCPTIDLIKQLQKNKIFKEEKLFFLPDPVININNFINQINLSKKDNKKHPRKYFIAVGRLTKQKNFKYLINEFHNFAKKNNDYDLLIFGEGEQKKNLTNQIINKSLNQRIFLMGYSKNIYYYMKNASAFILSSLWEEPGHVMIEAALCNLFVISSDCENGPKEFLQNGNAGLLFKNNKKNELQNKLEEFINLGKNINLKKINAKNNCKDYTIFRHYLYFKRII